MLIFETIWGLCNRKGGNSKKNKKCVNIKSEKIIILYKSVQLKIIDF
jgi:hypothetical protein